MSAPNFVNKKMVGFEYTEDDYPFSSKFRPLVPANLTSKIQMRVGEVPSIPSSTNLFYNFFSETFNFVPSYSTVMVWAAFDVLEKVLYVSAMKPETQRANVITPRDAFALLSLVQCATPIGIVYFDANRINAGKTIFIQSHIASDSENSDNEIISPSLQQTAEFIYPMPTWNERVYAWSLVGTKDEIRSTITAGVMTVILITIILTVFIHREDAEIRMFHYLHIILFCLSASAFCWGTALLYQGDMNQSQCNSYLWVIVLSASFFLSIVNMKAYRLSIFLISSSNGRRPKPFTHGKVLSYTMLMVFITALLLLIIALVDPPKLYR